MADARAPRWIDLAPGHKQGLVVRNPVILGAGSVGGGEAVHPELALRAMGAIVVGPLSRQSRPGAPMPRIVEVEGGLLIETGGQNRGLEATVRAFAPLWKRLGVPVIVQLAETEPGALARMAERLGGVAGVAGIELPLPARWTAEDVRRVVGPVARAAELPLWVKLPLGVQGTAAVTATASAAVEAGAVGVVVGSAPVGAAHQGGMLRHGGLQGAGVVPLMLEALAAVAQLALPAALIAAGSIATVEQARQALAVGAQAVQLESIVWIEPEFPGLLAQLLTEGIALARAS